jgi:hypothetical protein
VVLRWLDVPFARLLAVEHATDQALPGRGRRHASGDSTLTLYRAPERRR